MSKDRFTIELKCPACGRSGNAQCWQADGAAFLRDPSTTVTEVTPGFTRVNQPSGVGNDVNFLCDKCGKLCAQ